MAEPSSRARHACAGITHRAKGPLPCPISSRRRFLTIPPRCRRGGISPRLWAQKRPARSRAGAAAELIKPETQQAIDRGLAWLAARQNDDGSFGGGGYSRNVAVVSLAGMAFMSGGHTPGRGAIRPARRPLRRATSWPARRRQRLHLRAGLHQPRADVRPRLRHAVPGRSLRHVARQRRPREAGQGRAADRQHAERRGRLALSAQGQRGRHLGHDLPGDGPAGGPQRRHLRAQRDDRPLHRVRQAQPERRRRLHVHAHRRAQPLPALGGRRRRPVQRRHLRRGRDQARASST